MLCHGNRSMPGIEPRQQPFFLRYIHIPYFSCKSQTTIKKVSRTRREASRKVPQASDYTFASRLEWLEVIS